MIVTFNDFQKRYSLDMLVRGRALIEWKAAERLAPEHRAQLLNYLFLCDLPRGKLVNVRPEMIEHEFVNTTLRRVDRCSFRVESDCFHPLDESDEAMREFLIGATRDWGAGLDVHLYESAIAHVFGGEEAVLSDVPVAVNDEFIGQQKARLTSSGASFKVTSLYENEELFEQHARRFLTHTRLPAIHWINVTRHCLRFKPLLQRAD